MNFYHSNDINHYYLHISGDGTGDETIDFRAKMLLHNNLDGFVPMKVTYIDNKPEFSYDITGLSAIENFCSKNTITEEIFISMMQSLIDILVLSDKYLLNTDCFLFSPEQLYIDPITYKLFICYCPISYVNLKDCFHNLICYMLGYIDYNNNPFTEAVYRIQNDCIRPELTIKTIIEINITTLSLINDDADLSDNCINPELPVQQSLKPCKINKHLIDDFEKKRLNFRLIFPYIKLSAGSLIIYIILIFLQIKFHLLSPIMIILLIPVFMGILGYSAYKIIKLREKYYDAPILKELITKQNINEMANAIAEEKKSEIVIPAEGKYTLISFDPIHYDNIYIDDFPFTIGKISGQCNGFVFSPSVSRVHARITLADDTFYIQDLHSTSGTFLNGKRLNSDTLYPLSFGDTVAFSTIKFTFNPS